MESNDKLAGLVLYVEDDDTTRCAVSASLRRRVESLLVAENGKVALELFAQHEPDVVVTDIAMPVMNGLAMAREIKNANPDIPIIVTTAYSDTRYLLESIELGIDGYVLKPVDFRKLFETLRRCLQGVQGRKQLARNHAEREKLIAELQDALKNVKTLSGLLPICASCKRIRDDNGYWKQIEAYIAEHSTASFTHSLCAACMQKLYPEYADDAKDEK